MKPFKLSIALALVLAAMPLVSSAQDAETAEDAESPFSWTLTAASDYVFRGVSQTDEKPAAQVGFTYTAPVGFYAGLWASNVDFGDEGPDIELDAFVGYNTDLNDQWNLDLSVVRYTYHKGGDDYGDIDYNEYIAKVSYAATDKIALTGLIAYAKDYGNAGTDEFYYNLGSSLDVGNGFSVNLGAGYTTLEEDDGGARVDYFDGSLSVSRDFGPVNASLGYYGTFGSDADVLKDAGDTYDGRVALLLTLNL
ncbi:MAG TPA: TorF family putative porin [Pseudoxanthomonas sp.]|nr:TorF family putative porin [Pseudoxanthomonas sp.]